VVELGERLSEAVAREVMEETGIKITTGPLVKAVERIDRSEDNKVEYHYVILDFLCWGQYEKPRPLDDAADCCWSSVKDLTWARLDPLTTEVVEKALALV
jgi:ADP-ribose pyrophosphatase YjhB (NUDIX family)